YPDRRSTYVVVFLFASRRRHTGSKRDWSSDGCSSDLLRSIVRSDASDDELEQEIRGIWRARTDRYSELRTEETRRNRPKIEMSRSEERRVGKEGRDRLKECIGRKDARTTN